MVNTRKDNMRAVKNIIRIKIGKFAISLDKKLELKNYPESFKILAKILKKK